MSKRKILAAGYEDSGDEGESQPIDPPAFAKKSRSAVSALPRLSATPQSGYAPFQLPISKAPFGRSVSLGVHSRASSVPASVSAPSAPETPQTSSKPMSIDEDSSEPELDRPVTEKTGQNALHPKSKNPPLVVHTEHLEAPVQPTQARMVRLLERQISQLTTKFEQSCEALDMKYQKIEDKMTQLLNAIALVTSLVQGPGSGSAIQQVASVADSSIVLTNRMPTPELLAIIAKVSSLNMSKELGTYENAVKAFAREAWYHMLKISAAKEIRPFYEDDFGNPDVFPQQFTDPITGYCMPFPHWGKVLQKQPLWVPTYVDHFHGLISKEGGELAELLRSFSEEDIVLLLFNGPWKTAQTAWRSSNKTDADLQAMRARQASCHRAERKAIARSEHVQSIGALQGPTWAFLSHAGYMSDEQEEDGVVIVKRPSHRSSWINNLADAIRAAEVRKLKVRSGPTPLPRKIVVVELPIPSLSRGTGSSKSVLRIAAGAISKKWREEHRDDFLKYSALVDMKAVAKPDISDFLLQNPRIDEQLRTDSNVPAKTEKVGQLSGGAIAHEHDSFDGDVFGRSEGAEYDGAYGRHALSDDILAPALPLDTDDQEESPLPDHSMEYPIELQDTASARDLVPIDPQLFAAHHPEASHKSQEALHAPVPLLNAPVHGTTGSAMYQTLELHPPAIPPHGHPAMPPPPPPDAGATIKSTEPQPATAGSAIAGAPAPKKRGRPKGSKNKPKVPATE
ncbi:hypothetical protein FRC08_009391 [Ceratobasidium sp. 394]|nr:hypothetical protein FRC08_009391 [Ceratobasidium sp. 394]KAG9100231.1 hypothetical protein FS749_015930 [Ceratobasidium sp. UAMH 11750]